MSQHPAFLGTADVSTKRVRYSDEQGKSVLGFASKTKYGWTLVVQQDADEAYAPIADANRKALVLLVLTLVFVGVVSFVLAQGLTRPIRSLTQTADEISRGDLKATIHEVSRSDEIGALARAIDRMGASIKLALGRLNPSRAESGSGVWRHPGAKTTGSHRSAS
jgi:methyl-accepting chemotaxis protein